MNRNYVYRKANLLQGKPLGKLYDIHPQHLTDSIYSGFIKFPIAGKLVSTESRCEDNHIETGNNKGHLVEGRNTNQGLGMKSN